MKSLSHILKPLHHCEDATLFLLRACQVPVTASTIQKDLTEHPNYPSMLSISDVIKNYGVLSLAAKLDRAEWSENLAPPFLVHIKGKDVKHDVFAVVTHFDDNSLEIYNPELGKQQRFTNETFVKDIYRGTVMAVEPGERAGEKDFQKNARKDKRSYAFNLAILLFLPVLTLATTLLFLYNNPVRSAIAPVAFTLVTLTGVFIGILLLWHELDQYNPVVKQFCQASQKVNCAAVLNSNASKILGTSWSVLGLTYFLGTLIILLSGGLYSASSITLLGWMNLLAAPYIFYSVYYQWRVAKQWCMLCLTVQALLLLQLAASLAGGFPWLTAANQIPPQAYLTAAGIFGIIFIGISLLIPALQKAKGNRTKTIELQKLKHNTQIFDALLSRQRAIESSTSNLGIRMGNANGKYKVVKVCNPYCGPCAQAHPVLEGLLEHSDEVDLQIIFTASNDNNDSMRQPVRHLMAIAAQGDEVLTKKALNDWYGAPQKDYQAFASKYPMNGELDLQAAKIDAMHTWCDTTRITHTPTIFVNGHQLPRIYTAADLKYLLLD